MRLVDRTRISSFFLVAGALWFLGFAEALLADNFRCCTITSPSWLMKDGERSRGNVTRDGRA